MIKKGEPGYPWLTFFRNRQTALCFMQLDKNRGYVQLILYVAVMWLIVNEEGAAN